jgi:hypothetical protein
MTDDANNTIIISILRLIREPVQMVGKIRQAPLLVFAFFLSSTMLLLLDYI